ncbi:MAG: hypothetical protein QOJ86_3091 [Bradyrhizobium sp.]|jgi:hypothetical protein|nr:hypothetical protein [Bradyrhizobium sp.]
MRSYIQTGSAARYKSGSEDGAHRHDMLSSAPESVGANPRHESPQSRSLLQMRNALDGGPRVQSQLALQRALNLGGAKPAQAGAPGVSKRKKPLQRKPNATGLPDRLKAGVVQLSGLSMDDVRVHYNSAKPAQLQALAYAQGTDIHVAAGQEQHLPHEAWHVVQQKQGRVKPTLQLKGVAINDDTALEREADLMGAQADRNRGGSLRASARSGAREHAASSFAARSSLLQRALPVDEIKVSGEREIAEGDIVWGGVEIVGVQDQDAWRQLVNREIVRQARSWNRGIQRFSFLTEAPERIRRRPDTSSTTLLERIVTSVDYNPALPQARIISCGSGNLPPPPEIKEDGQGAWEPLEGEWGPFQSASQGASNFDDFDVVWPGS